MKNYCAVLKGVKDITLEYSEIPQLGEKDNVTLEEAALVEPLSVTFRACAKIQIEEGDHVLITGAGAIGICAILTARLKGASNICIVDKNEWRLDFAKKMGANITYRVSDSESGDTMSGTKKLLSLMGRRPDHAIDTTGASYPINLCIDTVEKGGNVILIGFTEQHVTMNAVNIVIREIKVFGYSVGTTESFSELLGLIPEGRINVKPLATHQFGLFEVQKAFEMYNRKEGMDTMIDCAKDFTQD